MRVEIEMNECFGLVTKLDMVQGAVTEFDTELDLVAFVLDSVPKPLLLGPLGHLVDGQVL